MDLDLDTEQAMSHANGDPEMLTRLCTMFLTEVPSRMDAVRRAAKSKSGAGLEFALDQLSGCLSIFVSEHACELTLALASAVRLGSAQGVARELKRMEDSVALIVAKVQRLMLEVSEPGSVQ